MRAGPPQALDDVQAEDRRRFREAAASQIVCAVCRRTSPWHPHHVVEKKWLKSNHMPLDDPDNALRLCVQCHESHTNAMKRLKLTQLLQRNLEYAFRTMGYAAGLYLRRFYDGEDPRLDALEKMYAPGQ